MKSTRHSPRDELTEPLRSIVATIADAPVPEELIQRAQATVGLRGQTSKRQRSGWAIVVSSLALVLCAVAFLFQELPQTESRQVVEQKQPQPLQVQTKIFPPPTLWAYRQASRSPERLDELLDYHAMVLLHPAPVNAPAYNEAALDKDNL